jgi:large subunit ribosomal protein L13
MRTKTYSPKAADLRPQWYVIDASSEPLGRLASRIAQILKGKNTPLYSPHMNTGDFVIVTNTKQVVVTGRKKEKKVYYRHTQYPGGLRETSLARMSEQHPNRVVFKAVKGMLPHNRLGRAMLRRLKLYSDAEHPHEAQVSASIKAAEKAEAEGPVYIGLPKPVIRRKPKKKRAKAPAVEAAAETAVAVPEGEETPTAETAAEAATGEVVSEPAVEEAPAEDAEAAAAPVDEAPGPVEEEGQESPAADEAPSDAAEPMAEPEPAEEPAEAAVVEQPEATADEAPVAEEQAIEEPESAAEEQEKASETEDKKAPE